MINDEIPFDLLESNNEFIEPASVVLNSKLVNSNSDLTTKKQERVVYFKTASDLISLVGNVYIHSIYKEEGIFGLKVRGYISVAYIQQHFNLTNLKQTKRTEILDSILPDFTNENSKEFIMLDKTTPYIKSVELVNGFLDFVMLKQGKMRSDFYTLEEITKIIQKINRHFEPYEAKDFVNRLLDLANINGVDRLMLLQDNPRNKHSYNC